MEDEWIESELAGYDHDAGTLRFAVDTPSPIALLRKLVAVGLEMESECSVTNGKARVFSGNGFPQSKCGIGNGELHGASRWYRKAGSLLRTGQFTLGTWVSTWRTFDRAGTLVKEAML